MAREVAAEVPTLQHTFAVGTAESSFTKYFLNSEWDVGTLEGERPDPDELMQLIFTSGTTGEPKGVMHTANTMFANVVPFAARMNLTARDVGFSPTPLAHQLGYLFGVLTPLMLGGTIVLQDIWNPAMAARLIEAERVTYCMGATPFLNDLAHFDGITGHDVGSLRYFISGGAPIPPALVQTATLRLGCKVIAIWGMTEVSAVTTVLPDDPPERASESDGTAMPHSEVRVADEGGERVATWPVRPVANARLNPVRGYFKRPQLYTVNEEGWLDTGDLARMDASGYIRITGRAKDIIIRGGENIPVVEIEAMLHGHPAVQMVAIVAMPDPRLGERACAFVLPRPGLSLAFEEMRRFLEIQRVAPAYLPERLVLLDAMPLTPAGKVQKFVLRERASVLAAE
jgi:cyclohexanecarboxylate-CoA ligase